jgi:hypothetical protein
MNNSNLTSSILPTSLGLTKEKIRLYFYFCFFYRAAVLFGWFGVVKTKK